MQNPKLYGVALSSDGRYALGLQISFGLFVWDTKSGLLLKHISTVNYPEHVQISHDTQWITVSGEGLHLYHFPSGKEEKLAYGTFVYDARPKNVKEKDIVAPDSEEPFKEESERRHYYWSDEAAFSPDGRQLAMVTSRGLVILDLATKHEVAATAIDVKYPTALAYVGQGRLLALGCESGVLLFDSRSGRYIRTFTTASAVRSLDGSNDGTLVVALVGTSDVVSWEISTGMPLYSYHSDYPAAVVRSSSYKAPDGAPAAYVFLTYPNEIRLLSLKDKEITRTFRRSVGSFVSTGFLNEAHAFAVATSRTVRYLTGVAPGNVRVGLDPAAYDHLTLCENGYFVTSHDNVVALWNKTTGAAVRTFRVQLDKQEHQINGKPTTISEPIEHLRCSPDASLVAAASESTIWLWDTRVQTGEPSFARSLAKTQLAAIAVSGDGKYIAAGSYNNTLTIWEVGSGREMTFAKLHRSSFMFPPAYSTLTFSPDGKWLAAGNLANYVELYDLDKRVSFSFNSGPPHGVEALAFSHDSKRLAGGGYDGEIWMWDVVTGNSVHHWKAHTGDITDLSFSSDGTWISSTGEDGAVRIWSSKDFSSAATLVIFGDDSWAVTDSAGRYDTSTPDTSVGLHWVAGTQVIELRQLKNRYYAPQLLDRILAGDRLPDVTGMESAPPPPIVSIDHGCAAATRKLNLLLKDAGGGIGTVVIKVNGRTVRTLNHVGSGLSSI